MYMVKERLRTCGEVVVEKKFPCNFCLSAASALNHSTPKTKNTKEARLGRINYTNAAVRKICTKRGMVSPVRPLSSKN